MNITILGAGAWGTALAIALAQRHNVMLWGREEAAMHAAQQQRENTAYLPGFPLPSGLQVTADFSQALAHIESPPAEGDALLVIASSVAGLRPLAQRLSGRSLPNLVWLCKGFEEESRLLPHQVVREVLGDSLPIGVLSGPSFAQEV